MKKTLPVIISLLITLTTTAQFTIVVDQIPENTPTNDPIHIAGDFQGWDPASSDYILSKAEDIYQITLPPDWEDISFKFTRGSWATVETDEDGNFVVDRTYSPVDGDTIFLQILGWEDLNGNGTGTSTASENVHIVSDSFYMSQFDRYRRVWIYLPPDYETSENNYPVLYMHDGQNVFDDLTSYVGEWQVDETLNALFEAGDPGIIVVAVDHGNDLRFVEYTPWEYPGYDSGEGDTYVDFLIEDLMPYINENYRTLTDRDNTGIMGSSLGGLISTYAGIEHQDVFSKVGAFSPAYQVNLEAFEHVSSNGKQQEMKFYQIAGTAEGSGYIDNMFAMHDTLLRAGFDSNEVVTTEFSDGQHSEWFWAREFEDAYLWLFRNNTNDVAEISSGHKTFQLYPNPAKEEITLEFCLETENTIHVEICDTAGTINKTIFSNELQTGNQKITFSIQELKLSSGVYVCRLTIGDQQATIKFVVLE